MTEPARALDAPIGDPREAARLLRDGLGWSYARIGRHLGMSREWARQYTSASVPSRYSLAGRLLEFVRARGRATAPEFVDATGLDGAHVRRASKLLRNSGLLVEVDRVRVPGRNRGNASVVLAPVADR